MASTNILKEFGLMKKAGIVIWIIMLIGIFGFVSMEVIPVYDADEAAASLGRTYDFSDDWEWVKENGSSEKISFPYTFPSGTKSVNMTKTVPAKYGGLAITLPISNAAIRVFLGDKPIYQAGYEENSNDDSNDNAQKNTDFNTPEDKLSNGETPKMRDSFRRSKAVKIGSTDNVIDIPEISEECDIHIIIEAVSPQKEMMVNEAIVAKRDVAIITLLRSNIYPVVCVILMLICVTIMVPLDIMRIFYGQPRRGLFSLALFGLDVILLCLARTRILTTFMGNHDFFYLIEMTCFLVMPILFAVFFKQRFWRRFPLRTAVILWFTTAMALLMGIGMKFNLVSYMHLYVMDLINLLVIILAMMYTLMEYRNKFHPNRTIRLEEAAYAFLLAAVCVVPFQELLKDNSSSPKMIPLVTLMALFFVTMTIQEILFIYREYQATAEENAARLQEQVDIAEEANRAKSRFLANMSHEIRTPINAVLGMDEMILRESKDRQTRDYAMDIYTAGQTLLSLINDILDFSKIESGKMEIVPVEYDTSSLINDLMNMTSPRAKAKDLILNVEVDPSVPARLFGDDVRIRQILTNILTNAVKYTREGSVSMIVGAHRAEDDEDCVIMRFEVRDTGIGMKEEDIPKLFTAYERIEESRNRNIEGTGLGMNITLQLLELMGSELNVDSVYGEGSDFWFDLKQKVVDDTPLGDFQERIARLSDEFSYTNSFTAPDARVLVVDDNSMNRKVFLSLLKPTDIHVDEAESGFRCLDLCTDVKYDMIFMDHMMPKMDGVETFHKLRNNDGPNRDTPCFILTANAVTGAKDQYLAEGFDGFLSKPIVSEKLEASLLKTLPGELIHPGRTDAGNTPIPAADTKAGPPDDLPSVDGLDWNIAWLHLPSTELLESSVKEYYDLIEIHGKKLEGFYEAVGTDEGMDEYRIQVHGMKSSAATIGIVPLAGMAKVLEFAARDKDITTITKLHDVFMREWYSMSTKLSGVFGIGEKAASEEREYADSDMAKAMFMMLQNAMEEMDIDAADEAMNLVMNYSFPPEIEEKLPVLKGAVADLDNDLSEEIINEIKRYL